MKFPWLQTVLSNVDVPSMQSFNVTTETMSLPIDSHLKAIPDMNSSPIRVPIDLQSIPINHMNSNPQTVIVGAPGNSKSGSSCDVSSSNPKTVPVDAHWNSKSSSSCDMSSSSPSSPCNIKLSGTIKCEYQEYFPRYSTNTGDVYSMLSISCMKCNQSIVQGSSHQWHPNMYVNSSSAGCVAYECECSVNKQLLSIEDIDNSDLQFQNNHILAHDHSDSMNPNEVVSESMSNNVIHGYCGNIPDLEHSHYPTSSSRPIMSPHQPCMRSLSPKYVLCIPMKRRKGSEIPNVSNKKDWYHGICQYCYYDVTTALDSRLYDKGRSYNKGQSYGRGWNCIPIRLVLHSPKTCSTFISSIHLKH